MSIQGVGVCNHPAETAPLKGGNSPKGDKFLAGVSKIYNTVADFFKEIGAFFKYHLNFKAALKDFKFKIVQDESNYMLYIKYLKNEPGDYKYKRFYEIHKEIHGDYESKLRFRQPIVFIQKMIDFLETISDRRDPLDTIYDETNEREYSAISGYGKACGFSCSEFRQKYTGNVLSPIYAK